LASFEQKIALHTSCSAIRGLKMASMSERVNDSRFSKPKILLQGVRGIEFADFERVDECCGFGGTFSVTREAVLSADDGAFRVWGHWRGHGSPGSVQHDSDRHLRATQ
jgi:Fe-S oxidoreductase